MKKILLSTLGILFLCGVASAQFEIKTNPFNSIIGNTDLYAEYPLNKDFALELGIGLENGVTDFIYGDLRKSGLRGMIAGKYYFNPKGKADRFNIGLYLRPRKMEYSDYYSRDYSHRFNSISLGVLAGYKWVGEKGLLLEFSAGSHRSLFRKTTKDDQPKYDRYDKRFILRLMVGYRFRKKARE